MYGFGSADQLAVYNAIVCPSGFNKRMFDIVAGIPASQITASEECVNAWGYTPTQMADPKIAAVSASHSSQDTQSKLLMAAGGAGVLLLKGPMKLAGVALLAYGFLRGGFIGGM
jgi:hypothetical protein